ncbi:hypothetical protein [Agrobacterium sp. Azo12]|uniref:hypothetical protein n=1 Tax=Agrobacterium sp. Azo12 TaxID=3031129 RepID=UPI0023D87893|nr:hypothetical protein [Agrobacterium sp. Azo12]MDO5896542.1 hypothetical protein [Agrobacterium sp. Azo12]
MNSIWNFIDGAMHMLAATQADPKKGTEPMTERQFACMPAIIAGQDLVFENGTQISIQLERPARVHVVVVKDGDDVRVKSLHVTEKEALDRIAAEMQELKSERGERLQ